jgi:hypothetical protein
LKDFFGDLLAGKFRNAARNFLPMVTGRGGPFLYGRRVDDAAFQASRYAGVFWEGRRFSIPLFVPNGRLAAIGFREARSGAALEAARRGEPLIRSMSCLTSTITSFSAGWYHLPYLAASRGGYLGLRSIFE